MTVGSLFSGIGGFDLGFQQAGFEVRWQVEIEPDAIAILSHRWPAVRRFRDINALVYGQHRNRAKHGLMLEPVDVIVGGFPCQDLSVAGKREGLGGARSGLFFAFMRTLRQMRARHGKPDWVTIENVPGLLSSQRGRDFHTVLSEVAHCGFRRAYRVLDSQYFGIPQRRRRVFVVGRAGGRSDSASPVLFESAGGDRHSTESIASRSRVASTLRGRAHRAGVNAPGRGGEDDSNLVTFGWNKSSSQTMRVDAHTTDALQGSGSSNPAIAATLNSAGNNGGFRTEPGEHLILSRNGGDVQGGYRKTVGSLDTRDMTDMIATREIGRALVGSMHKRHDDDTDLGQGHNTTYPTTPNGVRRLTPLECERLQGFPDGWTCLCGEGHRGSAFCKCADTPRYKGLGNAVSVPVARWIAQRIHTESTSTST